MKTNIAAFVLIVAVLALPAAAQPQAQATCPPAGYARADLEALKAADWAMPNAGRRNALARALTACLASPDPSLRDGIAYEGLFNLLRSGQLNDATKFALLADLEARLNAPEGEGFERPFAALALSEVARADRIQAYLSPAQRAGLVEAAATYLSGVRDYRGFDESEGWRHGVAHGSDLMLQLTLNPALGKPELTRLRDAIASQISPAGHFYIYGESERLARPILYMAQRGLFTEAEWAAWLGEVAGPGPIGDWREAFNSQAGLARRHNVNAFLAVIYLNARLSQTEGFATLLPGAEAAIRAVP